MIEYLRKEKIEKEKITVVDMKPKWAFHTQCGQECAIGKIGSFHQ